MLDQPRRPVDLDLFSQSIRIQSSQAEKIMAGLRDRLIRDLAKGKGMLSREGGVSPTMVACPLELHIVVCVSHHALLLSILSHGFDPATPYDNHRHCT